MGKTKRYFKRLWSEWQKDEVTRHAATLSYFAIFSLPAFMLVIVSIAGVFIDENEVRTQFFSQIRTVTGDSLATFLASSIENVHESGTSLVMNVLGILFLLFAAIGIFKELETSLNKILNVKKERKMTFFGFVRGYVLSLILLIAASTLLVASLAVGSVLLVLQSRITELSSSEIVRLSTLNQLVSYVTLGGLLFLLYRYLPAKRFPLKAVLIGTAVATTLFILGTFLLTFYMAQADVGHAYGVASSVLILLLWIFYSTNVFLLGAEVIDAYDRIVD
jgi:membrane protein